MTAPHVFRDALPPRILVIEDVDSEAEALESYLTQMGYRVERAKDGIGGLKLATANTPAVVILDLEMPRLNGVEVLRRLRSMPAAKSVHVVVTSGLVGARDRQLAFEAGCNQYIVKPFSLASLDRVLRTYFAKLGIMTHEG